MHHWYLQGCESTSSFIPNSFIHLATPLTPPIPLDTWRRQRQLAVLMVRNVTTASRVDLGWWRCVALECGVPQGSRSGPGGDLLSALAWRPGHWVINIRTRRGSRWDGCSPGSLKGGRKSRVRIKSVLGNFNLENFWKRSHKTTYNLVNIIVRPSSTLYFSEMCALIKKVPCLGTIVWSISYHTVFSSSLLIILSFYDRKRKHNFSVILTMYCTEMPYRPVNQKIEGMLTPHYTTFH